MKTLVKIEEIRQLIYTLRGVQVMIDSDLVELYRIEAKALNQAVSRNIERCIHRAGRCNAISGFAK